MIEGFIEVVLPFEIRGWARDAKRPLERMAIQLFLNEQLVASATADLFRPDLVEAGLGDGRHAFCLKSTAPIPWQPSCSPCVRASSIWGETVRLSLAQAAIERLAKPQLKVFIIGAPRSGTSVVLEAMLRVFDLPGHGESHVMPLVQRIIYSSQQYLDLLYTNPDDVLIKHLDQRKFEEHIFDYIRGFYEAQYEGQTWVDKTPSDEALHGAVLIERMFPDARIIALKRSGIEVVDSHLKKFGGAFEDACTSWKNAMEGLIIARRQGVNMLEVDQFDIANHPLETARRIAHHMVGWQRQMPSLCSSSAIS